MDIKNKVTFTVDEKEYCVVRPSPKQIKDANIVFARELNIALSKGLMPRNALDGHMRKNNLWDDEKSEEHNRLVKDINAGEEKLKRGGIKKSEARKIAIQMRIDRVELMTLVAERNSLDIFTAEGVSQQAQFNYFVTICTLDNETGKQVFANVDDYVEKQDTKLAETAASNFALLQYGLDKDYQKSLPENEFLIKYKFVNDDLKLVNQENHLVDIDGKLINEDYEYVDVNGNKVTRDGTAVEEIIFSEFLED